MEMDWGKNKKSARSRVRRQLTGQVGRLVYVNGQVAHGTMQAVEASHTLRLGKGEQ
jgi:hypothetical protein